MNPSAPHDLTLAFRSLRSLGRSDRLERLSTAMGLSEEHRAAVDGAAPWAHEVADGLIENAIGVLPVPLGVATNFRIDGVDRFIPMAIEETSVIAAASAAAKLVRKHGWITTRAQGRLVIGQIQLPRVSDPMRARTALLARRDAILAKANATVPNLVRRGGGFRDVHVRLLPRPDGDVMLVLHLLADPCDAMGANLLNQACEALRDDVSRWTGDAVGLCILSNLVDTRLYQATIELQGLDPDLAAGIAEASHFAELDPYRAATHNKGILNGVDAVLLATGNDWRAVEAGAHAFAARGERYAPLSSWTAAGDRLRGTMQLPMACGTVGGATRVHPTARAMLALLGVTSSDDLSRVVTAVGLVQNLAALRALSTDGIVRGHMRLHANNLAMAVGASGQEISAVARGLNEILETRGAITEQDARQVLEALRESAAAATA